MEPPSKKPLHPSNDSRNGQLPYKRVRALTIILVVFLIASIWIFSVSAGILTNPFLSTETIPHPVLPSQAKKPTVQLQTDYQNPFDKDTQYVNPFSNYKNPFDVLD